MTSEYLINISQIVIWNSHNMINTIVWDFGLKSRWKEKRRFGKLEFEEFANALMNVRS